MATVAEYLIERGWRPTASATRKRRSGQMVYGKACVFEQGTDSLPAYGALQSEWRAQGWVDAAGTNDQMVLHQVMNELSEDEKERLRQQWLY